MPLPMPKLITRVRYVVLSAISFSSDPTLFAAANSLYGISDLTALASDTHKFESR